LVAAFDAATKFFVRQVSPDLALADHASLAALKANKSSARVSAENHPWCETLVQSISQNSFFVSRTIVSAVLISLNI